MEEKEKRIKKLVHDHKQKMSRQKYRSRSVYSKLLGIKLLHEHLNLEVLEKLNRNKPAFQHGNKMDKFSFLLQYQLQSLCKRNKLLV